MEREKEKHRKNSVMLDVRRGLMWGLCSAAGLYSQSTTLIVNTMLHTNSKMSTDMHELHVRKNTLYFVVLWWTGGCLGTGQSAATQLRCTLCSDTCQSFFQANVVADQSIFVS